MRILSMKDEDLVYRSSYRATCCNWLHRCAIGGIAALLGVLVLARTVIPLGYWEGLLLGHQGKDEVHFAAHAMVGVTLNQLGLAPDIAGQQWLAAAAHVRTPAQADEAVNGLIEAEAQSTSASEFVSAVCAEGYGRRQTPVMQRAGLSCPPSSPTHSR